MSIVHDFRVDQAPVAGDRPLFPPQVMNTGDLFFQRVKIVYTSTGEKVPLAIIAVNCPEKFLWYYSTEHHRMMLPGDFRVEWED